MSVTQAIVIASSLAPTKAMKETFVKQLHALATNYEVRLLAIYGCEGPNYCYNLGIKIEGENWERFAEALTMAMMPAKFALCEDEFDGFVLEGLRDA